MKNIFVTEDEYDMLKRIREQREREQRQMDNPTYWQHPNDNKYGKAEKQSCMHDACTECNGTGINRRGHSCVHMISCPCPRCSPTFMKTTDYPVSYGDPFPPSTNDPLWMSA